MTSKMPSKSAWLDAGGLFATRSVQRAPFVDTRRSSGSVTSECNRSPKIEYVGMCQNCRGAGWPPKQRSSSGCGSNIATQDHIVRSRAYDSHREIPESSEALELRCAVQVPPPR